MIAITNGITTKMAGTTATNAMSIATDRPIVCGSVAQSRRFPVRAASARVTERRVKIGY